MNYIVFDLEWNQGPNVSEDENPGLPFEIIEIGAVKLNDDFTDAGHFSKLVRPVVYQEMNRITGKLVHIEMRDLVNEAEFPEVGGSFLEWCEAEESTFCVWGGLDLTELQRNLRYHGMPALSDRPIAFLDVQKLFSLAYEDGKVRRSLEVAVEMAEMEKSVPFHRAYADAYYTAKLLQKIAAEHPEVLNRVSFDAFHIPATRKEEVKIQFDTYAKYISRGFETKAEAFADREVASSKCYLCHRNLRKKIKWFSMNGKHYYCLAYCEKHGYLKGKIRARKSEDGLIYVVKTTKLIDEAAAEEIRQRSVHARELRKKHLANKAGTTT